MSVNPQRDEFWKHAADDALEPAYAALLGLDTPDAAGLHEALLAGLPYRSVEHLRSALDLSLTDLCRFVGIPYRTLVRRRREERLQPAESDRLVRLARLAARARELFGTDHEAARAWLTEPQFGLGGRVPLDFATTEVGAREVENLIGRIEHGIPL